MIDRLTYQQYVDLVAIIDGKSPMNAQALLREGLIESIPSSDQYKLTADGQRHYTMFRERANVNKAHLE